LSKQKMDIFLRDSFQRIPQKFVLLLTGKKGIRVLDTTFPTVKERKADFVVELEDGSIFHLELQTHPDKNMPLRMLEYRIFLMQKYPDKEIRQMVLYVGDGAPRMESSINQGNLSFSYELRDIKELSCRELMESSQLEDKILAVLCNVEEPERYFNELMEELLKLPEKERADYTRKLLTALHYRPKLKMVLKHLLEERKMPITITEEMLKQDPFYQEGLEKGKKDAIQKLYLKKHLSAEEIAETLELPIEFVKKAIDEIKNESQKQ